MTAETKGTQASCLCGRRASSRQERLGRQDARGPHSLEGCVPICRTASPVSLFLKDRISQREMHIRANASKLRWRATATPGWSTRLACCFRRLAGNTAWRLRKHTGFPNLCVFKSACRSQTHARRVSAASSRRQHASRVLHPEASARRHCDFDASALRNSISATRLAQLLLPREFKFLENIVCGGLGWFNATLIIGFSPPISHHAFPPVCIPLPSRNAPPTLRPPLQDPSVFHRTFSRVLSF